MLDLVASGAFHFFFRLDLDNDELNRGALQGKQRDDLGPSFENDIGQRKKFRHVVNEIDQAPLGGDVKLADEPAGLREDARGTRRTSRDTGTASSASERRNTGPCLHKDCSQPESA